MYISPKKKGPEWIKNIHSGPFLVNTPVLCSMALAKAL